MAVHLQRSFINKRRFINTFGQRIQSGNSYQRLLCLHDEMDSKKWRISQSLTRTTEQV